METRVKYPRTHHLPWSLGRSDDDIETTALENLERMSDIVVTEKLDGENTTLYTDYMHARSLDSANHPSRNWVKNWHAGMKFNIPDNLRICGENVYARHSIGYEGLKSYFYVFAIYDGDMCLSWDDTVEWAELLGLHVVPVLYRGLWDEEKVKGCYTKVSKLSGEQEGYVVRNANAFQYADFADNAAKFVRADHVQTGDVHWRYAEITPNKLRVNTY